MEQFEIPSTLPMKTDSTTGRQTPGPLTSNKSGFWNINVNEAKILQIVVNIEVKNDCPTFLERGIVLRIEFLGIEGCWKLNLSESAQMIVNFVYFFSFESASINGIISPVCPPEPNTDIT